MLFRSSLIIVHSFGWDIPGKSAPGVPTSGPLRLTSPVPSILRAFSPLVNPGWQGNWPGGVQHLVMQAAAQGKARSGSIPLRAQRVKKALLQGVPPSADGGIK